MAKDRLIIVSGYFDPLSIEELTFLKKCKSKGDWLIVGIHSDWYMLYAQGGYVQKYDVRREILKNVNCVDEIMTFNDSDGTVCQLLKIAKICYPDAMITYISQEDMKDMPEMKIKGIKFETMK